MNSAMFFTVIYIAFSILAIYFVARPSNRKAVLRGCIAAISFKADASAEPSCGVLCDRLLGCPGCAG